MDSLLSELPGKPKNTAAGSLSLLQGIFLTQKSNQGLLHCRQILYQLSYLGSLGVEPYFHVLTLDVGFERSVQTVAKGAP